MATSFIADTLTGHPRLSISALIAAPVVYLISTFVYNLYFHPLAKYPGPLICRASNLPWDWWQLSGHLQRHTAKAHQKYGRIVRLAPNELSYTDPGAWQDIYGYNRGKEQWPRHPVRVPQGKNAPKSIMNTVPDEHARFRRLLNYAFSEKGLQEQEPLITKYINLFVQRVGELADTGKTVDVTQWFSMVGFDIISDLGWNEPFNCVENRTEHSWIKTIVATAFDSQLKLVFRQHGLADWAPWFIPKHMQKARIDNFKYAGKRVEDRIQNGGAGRSDFWDRVMIKSADDNSAGEGLSKQEMIVTAVTLVGTGSETISTLLSGLAFFLCTNPHAMKKLTTEIRTAFASTDDMNIPAVHKLEYMNACLQETMRLYPPVVGLLWRVPPKGGGTVLGEFIPEGTAVNISLPGMFQDKEYFHRADDFVPERWMSDTPVEFKGDNKAAFRPFSMGTMNCLGQNLANAEARLILGKMLWHYDLELDHDKTGANWRDQKAWAVFVKKHLYVKFSPAQRQALPN